MLAKALGAASLIASGACVYIWYDTYFSRRDCFNDQGRCFDAIEAVVYHEQSGAIWLSIAIVLALVALVLLGNAIRRKAK